VYSVVRLCVTERWFHFPPPSSTGFSAAITRILMNSIVKFGPAENRWSRDRWRHFTSKGQASGPNTVRAQYLKNSYL